MAQSGPSAMSATAQINQDIRLLHIIEKKMTCLLEWLTWENTKVFFNSSFTTSLVGALAGAYAGARAAQVITERAKEQEQLIAQIRATNAATMVAFSAVNAGIATKRQHVQPMHEEYQRAKAELETFKQQRATGQRQGNMEYRFIADLRIFPTPSVPLEILKDLVFQKISAYGRPLALVTVIEQSFRGLREAIARRDALVHRFASGQIPKELVQNFYFGMPLPNGDTNQEYPDLVHAIHSYTDDVIFFSALLCTDLIAHGEMTRNSLLKKFGGDPLKVSTVDFAGPISKGLIPPDTQYTDWLNAFKAPNNY